jgi:cyclic pyranopterin phosphate synthase
VVAGRRGGGYAAFVPDPRDPDDSAEPQLTHLDARGRASMVDVSHKPATVRSARAEATLRLDAGTRARLFAGELPKGEALAVARVAGIQAAKETSRLIPLCHPLALSRVVVDFAPVGDDGVRIVTEVRTTGPTGVEMEALTAAAVAALTVYDMVKALCRGAVVETVQLLEKSGGASGLWQRPPAAVAP